MEAGRNKDKKGRKSPIHKYDSSYSGQQGGGRISYRAGREREEGGWKVKSGEIRANLCSRGARERWSREESQQLDSGLLSRG